MNLDVNWGAVVVGTIAHQIVGALWYGVIFKNTWIRATGINPDETEGPGAGAGYAFGAVCSFLSALALAVILTAFDDPAVPDGVVVGLITGLGFVAAATFMNGFYEQKKPVLGALFGGYYTVGLAAVGAIIGAWR